MLEFLFWTSLAAILVVWVGYPITLFLLAAVLGERRHLPVYTPGQSDWPSVTVIIAAYNEERHVISRINNLLEQEYPGPMEIIVGSDGSDDRTNDLVASLNHPQVRLAAFGVRRGRAAVHNDCVQMAQGEIVVFTDAETVFKPDYLRLIVQHFKDPRVGGAFGSFRYLNTSDSGISESAGFYWRYEKKIREAESQLGILAFGYGCGTALRKAVYKPLSRDEDMDPASGIDCVGQGYRIIYEPHAQVFDISPVTIKGAIRIKARGTSQTFSIIVRRIFQQKFLRRPALFASIIIHKLGRHLSLLIMLSVLICNIALLSKSPIYYWIFCLQLMFYFLAIVGFLLNILNKKYFLFNLPFNFVVLCFSRAIGVMKALRGLSPAAYDKEV